MHERHASPEAIRRFLRSELPDRDTSELIRHLLSRCPDCLGAAGRLAWASPGPGLPVLASTGVRRSAYAGVLASAERRLAAREQELARQRVQAVEQWRELRLHPPVRRRWRIRNDPRFGTWGFCERLLHECLALGRRDAGQTVELATLAVEAVERLSTERYGADRVADLEALAWGAVGEARRLQLDLAGAAEGLERAREAFGRGTGDSLEEAHLVSLEMSLAEDRGELERAADAFGWVARVYRRAGDVLREGNALLLQARATGQLDPERGLALLERARERADRGDRWIELCASHHRISFLAALGRPRQAAMLLAGSRHLYRPFDDLRTRLALRWLEGRVALSLGDLGTAEAAFEEVLPQLAGRGLCFQVTRLSLDLALVYQARGTPERILPLAFGPFAAEPALAGCVH